MVRSSLRVLLCAFFVVLAVSPLGGSAGMAGKESSGLLVYHQITDVETDSTSVGQPMLSGDGSTAAFTDAPASGDPEFPNRIYTIGFDGDGLTEVDAYTPLCYCSSQVAISDDGKTVVSTDSVQVRIVQGGNAEELLAITSNEITSIVLTGDGETVYFMVRRDAATADGAVSISRGVWAIDADGDNLRPVVGIQEVADLFGFPVEQSGCCFHGNGRVVSVSRDGGSVVFVSYGADGEYVLAVDGDGGNLHILAGPYQFVMRVAVSGDGGTAAWDGVVAGAERNEIATGRFSGGDANVLDTPPASEASQPIQLSADGAQLLVSPNGLLIDTASGDSRLLAVAIPDMGGNHLAVLTDGLPRATMNADATLFLYAMRTTRCADCANLPEQLATLEIDPADAGAAPAIGEVTIEPAEVDLAGTTSTTIAAEVDLDAEIAGVGAVCLIDGSAVDSNLGGALALRDDGLGADVSAADGTYTAGPITHAPDPAVETGDRTVRVAAEYEDSEGFRHASAIDGGILTVTGG